MKLLKKIFLLALTLIMCFAATACGDSGKTADGKTIIEFWGWGDSAETAVFSKLVAEFNSRSDSVHVNFTKRPSDTYDQDLQTKLGSRQTVDVAFVGDSSIKKFSSIGKSPLIEDLTSYVASSDTIDLDDLWDTQMERYQFDNKTFVHSESAPIWGLPKDLGPTVMYYNKTVLNRSGITVIEDMPIELVVNEDEKHGFYIKNGVKYFNNRIAMSIEELLQMGKLLTKGQTPTSITDFGFYSQWWFYLGWSVGGDVLKYIPTDDAKYNGGYYDFTLGDTEKNYIVKADNIVVINGKTYNAGEIITYGDRAALNATDKEKCTLLPSMREMFDLFVSMDTGKDADGNNNGNKISPQPNDSVDSTLFTSGKLAMYVEGRYMVPEFRRDCKFEWDVAPLPKHSNGIAAGHSGSMCLVMSSRSKNKAEAFKLIEFLSGKEGQTELVKTGFNVPNQKSLAYSDAFLKSDMLPKNNIVFLEAAEVQGGGDWTILPDDAWISIWAPTLNGDVRNGKSTVNALFSKYSNDIKDKLKVYTEVKK